MSARWMYAVALVATALFGQERMLRFEPADTRVEFTVPSTLHTVHGTFKLTRGEIRFDPVTGKASGALVVDAASGDSDNGARDNRMHKSVLESPKYGEITFTPDRAEGKINLDGDSDLRVHGTFRIHGGDHELVIPIHAHIAQSHVTVDTKFVVPYVKWGMKNPSTLFLRVNDMVEIEIHAGGKLIAAGNSVSSLRIREFCYAAPK